MAAKKKRAKRKTSALTATERRVFAKLAAKAGVDLPRIETPRANTTGRKIRNTTRAFWSDGVNAYLRRKRANPAIIKRTDDKTKSGEYTHVKTSDDVEIYEIAEWSPMRRKRVSLDEMPLMRIEATIIRSACKADWRLYYDAVSEYAHRFKNGSLPPNTAEMILQQQMRYIEHRIMRRGGPTPMMIHHELGKIRRERTGTRIYLPH